MSINFNILYAFNGSVITLNKKKLNQLMIETEGWIMKGGHLVHLGYKKIASDVYRIFIKEEQNKCK